MPVHRLTQKNLFQILKGETLKRRAICIIKFYSNGCHLCHNLRNDYQSIADSFSDDRNMYFFAFNIEDLTPGTDMPLNINGVPTICKVKTGPIPKINILKDPSEPDKSTWYRKEEIQEFVESPVSRPYVKPKV